MQRMRNTIQLFGRIYEHDLKKAVTGQNSKNPGTEYITGTVSIATDDNCLNVVPVHYTFVTAATKTGKPNATFATLSNIIDGVYGTVMKAGKENAAFARVDTQIGLNEFYTDRNGETTLVSAKRPEGGFIHIQARNDEVPSVTNEFKCDMLITNVRHIEADEDKNLPEKAIVKGAIFNDYNKTLMPVEFTATKPDAIGYLKGQKLLVIILLSLRYGDRLLMKLLFVLMLRKMLLVKILCVKLRATAEIGLLLVPREFLMIGMMKAL